MLTPEECYEISQAVYRRNFATVAGAYGDDLVQEGAISIWRGQAAYREGLASERTFASRVARNAMVDALRRLVRPTSYEALGTDVFETAEPAFEEDLTAPEASETWRRVAMSADGDRVQRWREIVAGRLYGMADSEIARRLGVSKASMSREAARLATQASLALGFSPMPVPQPATLRITDR